LARKALAGASIAASATAAEGTAAAHSWAALKADALGPVRNFLEEVEQGGMPTIGKLMLATGQIEKLANETD
jgi:NAD-specific glutamate dehydrogenase